MSYPRTQQDQETPRLAPIDFVLRLVFIVGAALGLLRLWLPEAFDAIVVGLIWQSLCVDLIWKTLCVDLIWHEWLQSLITHVTSWLS